MTTSARAARSVGHGRSAQHIPAPYPPLARLPVHFWWLPTRAQTEDTHSAARAARAAMLAPVRPASPSAPPTLGTPHATRAPTGRGARALLAVAAATRAPPAETREVLASEPGSARQVRHCVAETARSLVHS
jgi:hypothetical protein